ncbi:hypothetical protein F8271_28020 [Micromonospora sp. ALFpr18c]|nr:hypothetical protein F8271_28020 [Micromonospora sp. ALFpr18c]
MPPPSSSRACGIAMRHADDHVHIVATLAREDGRTDWLRNDYPHCVKATYNVVRRYNRSVGSR